MATLHHPGRGHPMSTPYKFDEAAIEKAAKKDFTGLG